MGSSQRLGQGCAWLITEFRGWLLAVCLTVAFVTGCSPSEPLPPPVAPPPSDLWHTVAREGETLVKIAKWYTGDENQWSTILKANPSIEPKRIKIGSVIVIPAALLKTREPLPGSNRGQTVRVVAPAPKINPELGLKDSVEEPVAVKERDDHAGFIDSESPAQLPVKAVDTPVDLNFVLESPQQPSTTVGLEGEGSVAKDQEGLQASSTAKPEAAPAPLETPARDSLAGLGDLKNSGGPKEQLELVGSEPATAEPLINQLRAERAPNKLSGNVVSGSAGKASGSNSTDSTDPDSDSNEFSYRVSQIAGCQDLPDTYRGLMLCTQRLEQQEGRRR